MPSIFHRAKQYAFFLKDLDIDVEAIANEVFSSDAIKGIPDDVAAAFESGAAATEDMMAMMLNVPSMAKALKTAGVDIDLFVSEAPKCTLLLLHKCPQEDVDGEALCSGQLGPFVLALPNPSISP